MAAAHAGRLCGRIVSMNLSEVDIPALRIVYYPHPVLRKRCAAVETFDAALAALARQMLTLMHASRGVGLAGPQVNVPLRLFVMNATGEEGDDRVFVNPEIHEQQGNVEAEEGCLSIPGVNVSVRRAQRCKIVAQDLRGQPVETEDQELIARIWQHETDHLNGVLILDRMGPTDKIATKKTLRALENAFTDGGG